MSFDKPTRNLLAKMTAAARDRLAEDTAAQLQSSYGLYPDGSRLDVAQQPEDRHAAAELRALLDHFESAEPEGKQRKANAYQRLVREIGFTLLNRLAALRLCEERGLVIECVRSGMNSAGYQLYDRLAGGALGNRYQTYQAFLACMFDELAADLGALFDRITPQSAVFPSEPALNDVLTLLNDPELASRRIWQQDETIGWIYQYFNDPGERKVMRESKAPRSSRELAVRNQFFTPRYVVEFLTDNTLGRTWYEMRQGQTKLTEQCRYLVQRRHPIFLAEGQEAPAPFDPATAPPGAPDLTGEMWVRPNPELESISELFTYALTVGGYDYARQVLNTECGELANRRREQYAQTGKWEGSFEELRCCLFFEQRRYHHFSRGPEGEDAQAVTALHKAICEQWDREVDVVPFHSKKDPRRLRVLDPACGSGHFLLYAFNLLETIYAEAYDDPDLGADLQDAFPDRADFTRQVPRLILENNLHGIDIDPRAAQIAALALWLRAQRAWQAQKLGMADRPQIGRTHVVVAEPMPGDEGLLEEFIADLPKDQHPEIIGPLVRTIFEKMKLAGEAGSLLKIEEELKESIEQARISWSRAPQPEQLSFLPGQPKPKQLGLDLSGATDESFWQQAEGLVMQAMEDYAQQAENGKGMRRRLFAGDTVEGFAFVDLCRKKYDVVVMNPPFGLSTIGTYSWLQRYYKLSFVDLYACFVSRGLSLAHNSGFVGAITSRAFFTIKKLEEWRKSQLNKFISLIADLGSGVMDKAFVESCAYVISPSKSGNNIFAINSRSSDQKEKSILFNKWEASNSNFYVISRNTVARIPGQKLLYSISPDILNIYEKQERFEPLIGTAREGMRSFDDFRFLRLRWEVQSDQIGIDKIWEFMPKGGKFSRFYSDIHLLVKWNISGNELSEVNRNKNGQVAQSRQAISYYHRSGCTYTKRSAKGFSARALPQNCIINVKGPAVFSESSVDLYYLLGWLNSRFIRSLLHLQANAYEFVTGIIKNLPWMYEQNAGDRVKALSYRLTYDSRKIQSEDETDSNFWKFMLLNTIEDSFLMRNKERALLQEEIDNCHNELDELIDELYKIDSRELEMSLLTTTEENVSLDESNVVDDDEEEGETENLLTISEYCRSLFSYLFGITLCKWEIRFLLNKSLTIQLDDPFSSVPVCPPGVLVTINGFPASTGNIVSDQWLIERRSSNQLPVVSEGNLISNNTKDLHATISDEKYPIPIPWDGILVDDQGISEYIEPHEWDIIQGIERVLQLLWPKNHEAVVAEACQILGLEDLREYFRKPSGFFADHLKRYSKSRRQAPIYWPLSTPSGSYTLWIYYHRLNSETLYTAVNRFVSPKIEQVERYLGKLEDDLAKVFGRSAGELRDKVDSTRAFLVELNEFRSELLRVANLPYQPDLNDGVIINAAPLYKLFRLTKWARDCQSVWEKLEGGEYDWAHMAYVLWPDRVREKCKKDKSLAIAHGVEELYQGEKKGKKGKRKKTAQEQEGFEF